MTEFWHYCYRHFVGLINKIIIMLACKMTDKGYKCVKRETHMEQEKHSGFNFLAYGTTTINATSRLELATKDPKIEMFVSQPSPLKTLVVKLNDTLPLKY